MWELGEVEEKRKERGKRTNKSQVLDGWRTEKDYNKQLEGCRKIGTGVQTKTCTRMFTAMLNNSQRVELNPVSINKGMGQ